MDKRQLQWLGHPREQGKTCTHPVIPRRQQGHSLLPRGGGRCGDLTPWGAWDKIPREVLLVQLNPMTIIVDPPTSSKRYAEIVVGHPKLNKNSQLISSLYVVFGKLASSLAA